jgi:hypothetical protein
VRSLSYEEQVSELFQAGWRLDDIASLTPWSRRALFLPRDQTGRLVRDEDQDGDELPAHVKVNKQGMRIVGNSRCSLEEATKMVNQRRGFSKAKADELWKRWEADNPEMGLGGVKRRKKKRKG